MQGVINGLVLRSTVALLVQVLKPLENEGLVVLPSNLDSQGLVF
jgi:hypothetical protein